MSVEQSSIFLTEGRMSPELRSGTIVHIKPEMTEEEARELIDKLKDFKAILNGTRLFILERSKNLNSSEFVVRSKPEVLIQHLQRYFSETKLAELAPRDKVFFRPLGVDHEFWINMSRIERKSEEELIKEKKSYIEYQLKIFGTELNVTTVGDLRRVFLKRWFGYHVDDMDLFRWVCRKFECSSIIDVNAGYGERVEAAMIEGANNVTAFENREVEKKILEKLDCPLYKDTILNISPFNPEEIAFEPSYDLAIVDLTIPMSEGHNIEKLLNNVIKSLYYDGFLAVKTVQYVGSENPQRDTIREVLRSHPSFVEIRIYKIFSELNWLFFASVGYEVKGRRFS